jgi:hypothetical protein
MQDNTNIILLFICKTYCKSNGIRHKCLCYDIIEEFTKLGILYG